MPLWCTEVLLQSQIQQYNLQHCNQVPARISSIHNTEHTLAVQLVNMYFNLWLTAASIEVYSQTLAVRHPISCHGFKGDGKNSSQLGILAHGLSIYMLWFGVKKMSSPWEKMQGLYCTTSNNGIISESSKRVAQSTTQLHSKNEDAIWNWPQLDKMVQTWILQHRGMWSWATLSQ